MQIAQDVQEAPNRKFSREPAGVYRLRRSGAGEVVAVERVRPMTAQALERCRVQASRAEEAKHRQGRSILQRLKGWLLGA